ncbi:MAG: PAS domain S-box protein [Pyrinomonadaceae bacterium]
MNTTTILVVDDTLDLLDLYSIWLREAGYKVLQASTGRECLRLVTEQSPDLVLLDVMLPDIDGIEVCKIIKSNEQTAAIPVINVSGRRTSADREAEGLEAGADGYLTKPFEQRTLLAHVRALLRMKQTEEALERSEERFRAAFDNALDAMLIADDNANYVDANPSACAMFGVSKEEMLRCKLSDFVDPGREHEFRKAWQSFLEAGQHVGEFRLFRPDGTTCELEYRAKARLLPNRHLWVLRDVTQRKQAEEELRLAHAELEKRVEQRTAELIASNTFLRSEILERQTAQEALAASEEKYRDLFENSKDAIYVQDLRGNYISVNRAAERLSGYTRDEILGRHFSQFVAPEHLEEVRNKICTKLEGQTETEYELEIIAKDGRHIPVELNSNLIIKNGVAVGIQGTARDITERKHAAESLRNAKEKLQTIFDAAPIAILGLDLKGRITSWSASAERMFGWKAEQTLGQLCPTVPVDGLADFDEMIERVLRDGPQIGMIYDRQKKTGERIRASISSAPLFDDTGTANGVMAILEDITERQRAEQMLRESEERFRQLVEDVRDYAIFMLDPDGNIESWNEGAKRINGYTQQEIIGKNFSCFYPPEDIQSGKPAQELKVAMSEGRSEDEGWRVRKDGSRFWANTVVTALCDESGNLRGFSKLTRDVTDRRRVEAALRQSEEQYRELVENINDVIYATDEKGVITYISQAVERTLGFSASEIIGQTFTRFIFGEDKALALENFQNSGDGISSELEFRVVDKSGGIHWVSKSSRPLFHGKTFKGTRGLVTDITERKHAEASRMQLLHRLVTAQEEEQRRLSRELHDQTGQSLAALMLGLKSIEDSDQLTDTARDRLRQLQELTSQLARDVHHLASNLRPTALDDLGLHTALSNYVEEWSNRTNISADFHSNGLIKKRLPRSIETAVYRIVQEALTNVLKHANAQNVSVILEYRGNRVQAIIEDNGYGFDTERVVRARNGTGRLGLLGMQERVALVDGQMNIESRPSAGTTVIVHIPVLTESSEAHT